MVQAIPWADYLTVDKLKDARPFQDYDVISPELIATIDMIVTLAAQPSCCTMANSLDEFWERRDWYARPDVRAKFEASYKRMKWD